MSYTSPIQDVASLTQFGRERLSENFFMREMLCSEVANVHRVPNIPENPELALKVGREIATRLLEPLKQAFGHVAIRSAYRSPRLNSFCNERYVAGDTACWCTDNASNAAKHIWDMPDEHGFLGGTITLVIPSYLDHYERTGDFAPLAWWIRDHIEGYADLVFFRQLCAFNIRWNEGPNTKAIWLNDPPKREQLTGEGLANFHGDHSAHYHDIIPEQDRGLSK
ncbi:hypothetical protein [Roseibium sp. M-1]